MTSARQRDQVRVDDLADEIQSRVMTGEIPLGSWLRQEPLAREFGVSRTPVREAIRKLQASGLVEMVPNRGAQVRGPSVRELLEAFEVRAELEGLAARIAATRIDAAGLDDLARAAELFRVAGGEFARLERGQRVEQSARADWVRANDLFHRTVQLAAGNERLRLTIAEVHRSFPRSLTSLPLVEDPRLMASNVADHHAVLDAIRRGEPDDAQRAMREHVLRAGDLVARWFSRFGDGGPAAPLQAPATRSGGRPTTAS